jgi:hypothetical protein
MQANPRESSSYYPAYQEMVKKTSHPIVKFALAAFAALLIGLSGCRSKSYSAANTRIAEPGAVRQAIPMAPQLAPLPPGGVKAIYLTGWSAGGRKSRQRLVDLVDRTGINAMVIDIKDDGNVTYQVDVPLAKEVAGKMDGNMKQIANIDQVMETLQKHNIFPIARIACFRDKPMGLMHHEMAVHNQSGGVWKDKKGNAWLNPYEKAAWDYNVDLALDALKHGFKEIQFDYVRFPTDGKMSEMVFPDQPEGSKHEDQIVAFLKYAHEKIHAAGGWFSADVFGLTSMVKNDEGIGQKFVKVVQNVDYLCPMVYPSHYAHGEYRIPNPNAEPYKIVHLSVGDAQKRLKTVKTNCKLRPWIQDFTLGAPRYGVVQVTAEMKALSDLGIHEYLLWNARNHYTEAAFGKPSGQETKTALGGAPQTAAGPLPGRKPPADANSNPAPTDQQSTRTVASPVPGTKQGTESGLSAASGHGKGTGTTAAMPPSAAALHKQ